MRACIVAHRVYDSNAHLRQFAQALAGRGDQVDAICLRAWDLPSREVVEGVNVRRVLHRSVKEKGRISYLLSVAAFMLSTAFRLAWRHLRSPYHLIHVQAMPDCLVFAALIPKLLGAKVILDLRDVMPEFYASKYGVGSDSVLCRMLAAVERRSARAADHVIVANPIWVERVAARSAPRAKCTMIWYSPDPKVWHPRRNRRDDGRFIIVYPGTLNWHQGVDIAVRALPSVLQEVPEAEFHIYGNGADQPRLAEMAKHLGIEHKVRFFDPRPLVEIAAIMADADLAVVPKRVSSGFGDEAASTKIWEFMALGVPVVATRTRVESIFLDDSLVRFFESENVEELAEAILSIRKDAGLRERLSQNGLDYIRRHGWTSTVAAYRDLVDGLVSGSRARDGRRPEAERGAAAQQGVGK